MHSQYRRTLADLPWADYTVRRQLTTRKWFCATTTCRRRIFTERLPLVVAPWGRRTYRLADQHHGLGLTLGGSAGTRRAAHLDQPTSRATLLRAVRLTPEQDQPTPKHLGVDDFALRKGRSYGTILIDLDTGSPIELLPDRTAATLAQWLTSHPGIELISRDRAGAYAEGARQGAPTATQVADRWHLLKNLGDALHRLFADYPHVLATMQTSTAGAPDPDLVRPDEDAGNSVCAAAAMPSGAAPAPHPALPQTRSAQERQPRHARRQARYDQVQALVQQGVSLRMLAQHLHLSRVTVRKYASASTTPTP